MQSCWDPSASLEKAYESGDRAEADISLLCRESTAENLPVTAIISEIWVPRSHDYLTSQGMGCTENVRIWIS